MGKQPQVPLEIFESIRKNAKRMLLRREKMKRAELSYPCN
jgi:hypothetical protein